LAPHGEAHHPYIGQLTPELLSAPPAARAIFQGDLEHQRIFTYLFVVVTLRSLNLHVAPILRIVLAQGPW
jgi:hypothetical protein